MTDHFERYLTQRVPEILRDGPPPDGWEGEEFGWTELRDLARERWRSDLGQEFVHQLQLGWTAHEILNGPDPGTEVILGSGAPKRPLPKADSALRARAQTVLSALTRMPPGILDAVLETTCRSVAFEAGGGDFEGAEEHVRFAEQAVADWRAAHAHEAQVERNAIRINVHFPFRSSGGRHWQPGVRAIAREEAEELRRWAEGMESQRDAHGWETPHGFAVWPPFAVITPSNPAPGIAVPHVEDGDSVA